MTEQPLAVASTPSSKSQRRRYWVQRQLARCALDLVRTKGYQATTVEDIAGAADYHASSFFRYFGSKEEAVFMGLRELTDDFRDRCATIDADDDVWAFIRDAMVQVAVTFTEADPEMAQEQVSLWFNDPELEMLFARHFFEWERIIAHCFARARGLDRPDLYAEVASGAVISAVRAAFRIAEPQAGSFAEYVDRACTMLEAGLGGPPTT